MLFLWKKERKNFFLKLQLLFKGQRKFESSPMVSSCQSSLDRNLSLEVDEDHQLDGLN